MVEPEEGVLVRLGVCLLVDVKDDPADDLGWKSPACGVLLEVKMCPSIEWVSIGSEREAHASQSLPCQWATTR